MPELIATLLSALSSGTEICGYSSKGLTNQFMDDPRLKIIEALDLDSSRIQFQPTVFLCGGDTNIQDHKVITLRKSILENAHKLTEEIQDGILIAEEYKDYNADGLFPDLMTFESHLAGIAHSIVIILESAGSIAELGAFSQNPSLHNKIFAFVQDRHFDNASFIQIAILNFLSDRNEDSVMVYAWDPTPLAVEPNIPNDTISHVIDDISKFCNKARSQAFIKDDVGHQTVLVKEFIRLFTAITQKEILQYLQMIWPDFTDHNLKRILYILESFNVIKKQTNGKAYYVLHKTEFHTLNLRVKENSEIQGVDIGRGLGLSTESINMACSKFYREIRDTRREGAIAKAIDSGLLK